MLTSLIAPSGPPTLGLIFGTSIGILITLIFVVFAVIFFVAWAHRDRDPKWGSNNDDLGWGWAMVGVALVSAVMTAWLTWPFSAEFHQWRAVSGTVEQIGSRQISDGKAMSIRYVVRIQGHPFAIDDTRAALLKVGDTVHLRCKREYQFAANSGWACRWDGA